MLLKIGHFITVEKGKSEGMIYARRLTFSNLHPHSHSSSLIPHTYSLIPYTYSLIPYTLSLIPYTLSSHSQWDRHVQHSKSYYLQEKNKKIENLVPFIYVIELPLLT